MDTVKSLPIPPPATAMHWVPLPQMFQGPPRIQTAIRRWHPCIRTEGVVAVAVEEELEMMDIEVMIVEAGLTGVEGNVRAVTTDLVEGVEEVAKGVEIINEL